MKSTVTGAVIVVALGIAGCSAPAAAKCSKDADCPPDAVCASGVCQKGIPSGGSQAMASGAGRLSGGSLTMDAVVGAPAPSATGGAVVSTPAEMTR